MVHDLIFKVCFLFCNKFKKEEKVINRKAVRKRYFDNTISQTMNNGHCVEKLRLTERVKGDASCEL